MANGIIKAAARFACLNDRMSVPAGAKAAALVVKLEDGKMLRASLGPELFRRLVEMISQRLVAELRLIPDRAASDGVEICGMLLAGRAMSLSEHLAGLGVICRSSYDLGGLRVSPIIKAAVVSHLAGSAPAWELFAYGRQAVAVLSPLTGDGQIRVVEYVAERWESEAVARPAFPSEKLRLDYQPQICCHTGRTIALRAVPVVAGRAFAAQDLEKISTQLGPQALGAFQRLVLHRVLRDLKGWDRIGRNVPFVSVGLTDRGLADPTLVETILWELDRCEIAASRMEIEMQEPGGRGGGAMPVATNLRRLVDAGCRLAMAEFGKGAAGLDDLRRCGIGRVRVGREFVAGCDFNVEQQNMILAILALAEHLGLETLADDVRTVEERAFLSQIGFDALQGEAVAARMTASETDDFLLNRALAPRGECCPPIRA
ncbi:EAL domain-containing protein [Paracoccus sp. MBLB3053]|uniref:EAL domain-containing protein n=1 Tax=Paracoccus aurantius TaxID=3073814 RepID=A0ABU2HQR2_9RHOB|nr:EAL domain-containing protein [Paracoccus sp. MBLB3053]MDS9467376.1 EAL domain-containing protein [Paracoccus sp. MBLB3053]